MRRFVIPLDTCCVVDTCCMVGMRVYVRMYVFVMLTCVQGFVGWKETSAKDNSGIAEASELLVRSILELQGVCTAVCMVFGVWCVVRMCIG